jgi:ATP-dependent exoDNAse (exonuclease V) alpha subunit
MYAKNSPTLDIKLKQAGLWSVINTTRATEYEVELIGDDSYSCTCQAAQWGSLCKHIKGVRALNKANDNKVVALFPTPHIDAKPGHEMLPGIYATRDQSKALADLIAFTNTQASAHALVGAAGTGKTLVLQAFIQKLKDLRIDKRICFTAPTNKATQVLQNMVNQWGLGVECVTCAKLLGLKPTIDKAGNQKFTPSKYEDNLAQDYDLIVVDECSMVSADLWGYLIDEANLLTQLLFVGDAAQLPPVNEKISKAFMEIPNPSLLDEVKRYGGAIGEVATDIRRNLQQRSELAIETSYNADGSEGIFKLTHDHWRESITKAFLSEQWKSDPNFCKVLAYTNRQVASHNRVIRNAIYTKPQRFMEGERLVANSPYILDKTVIFPTSAEMEVLEVWQGTQGSWKVWMLRAQMLDNEGGVKCFPVLHESENGRFKEWLKGLKDRAKQDHSQWRRFYEQKGLFADVDYAYAGTVHKAQGSTYRNVFVDVPNIMTNRTPIRKIDFPGGSEWVLERNQLLYTAITRPSHRLFVPEF